MNAPCRPPVAESDEARDLTPSQDSANRASVSIHYPNVDTYEMEVRCELMELRDRSAVALNRCCAEAVPTLLEANRLAGLLALSNQSAARLTMAMLAIRSLMQAANCLQRVHRL